MHADEMEEIDEVRCGNTTLHMVLGCWKAVALTGYCRRSGEIAALFGVNCHSGDTFTTGTRCSLTSMFVPPAVVSLAINMSKVRSLPEVLRAAQAPAHLGATDRARLTLPELGHLPLRHWVLLLLRLRGYHGSCNKPPGGLTEGVTGLKPARLHLCSGQISAAVDLEMTVNPLLVRRVRRKG